LSDDARECLHHWAQYDKDERGDDSFRHKATLGSHRFAMDRSSWFKSEEPSPHLGRVIKPTDAAHFKMSSECCAVTLCAQQKTVTSFYYGRNSSTGAFSS